MNPIMELAKKYNLVVIEDSAQAIGAEYKGRKVCSIGDIGCLSFFPTKNLGCFGDGGMVLTNSEELYYKVKMLRAHGSKKTYRYDILGFNSRLDEIQAAILRAKFKYLNRWNEKRRKNASRYNSLLKEIEGIALPYVGPNVKHVFHQYTIRINNRDRVFESLKSKGIGTMVYYPLSLHLQNVYKSLGYKLGDLKESEKAQQEVLSLPIFPELKDEEIKEVVTVIKQFLA